MRERNPQFRLKPDEIEFLGLNVGRCNKYRLDTDQQRLLQAYRERKENTVTNQYEAKPKRSILTALNDNGQLMDIDEYCRFYNLNREEVRSYKLVTHTGVPYYNIASGNVEEGESEFDVASKVKEILDNYTPKHIFINKTPLKAEYIGQVFFSDTHIGMEPDADQKSLFGGSWNLEDLEKRRLQIVNKAINILPNDIDCLQVINLGDFADGLDGRTVRREHDLPQNLTNDQVFDGGVDFMTRLFEDLYSNLQFNTLKWYNVCNSNHSSSFDYFISQSFKGIAERNYQNVSVHNERKFIGHMIHGRHCEILTHGKDDRNLKFGFKATLDDKGKDKINDYIKYHNLLQYFNSFHKGDSHLSVIDKTCPDFEYHSHLALSPSSSWVQTNHSRGRSGFRIIIKDKNSYSNTVCNEFEFEWNSNNLK